MKSAASALIYLLLVLTLGACDELDIQEEDVDFDRTDRTTDITYENAELIALGTIQSVVLPLAYLPLHEFLDASELPQTAFFDPAPAPDSGFLSAPIYRENCVGGGVARYQYTRAAGEDHRAGDRVLLDYDGCVDMQGVTRNGRITARYTVVDGLNKRFMQNETEACVANLEARISGTESRLDVSADAVLFYRRGATLEVHEASEVPIGEDGEDGTQYETDVVHTFSEQDRVIIVNTVNVPAGPTSMGGDEVFSLVDGAFLREKCQSYRRRLSLSMLDYRANVSDMDVMLTGTVTYEQETEDDIVHVSSTVDSAYRVTVNQGARQSVFDFYDANIAFIENLNTGATGMRPNGMLRSSALFGTVELESIITLESVVSQPLPDKGRLEVNGRGLERLFIDPDESAVTLQIDFDGDSNGDTFPDIDDNIFTTWARLLSRDFVEVPLQ